jgi:hypothetical protein
LEQVPSTPMGALLCARSSDHSEATSTPANPCGDASTAESSAALLLTAPAAPRDLDADAARLLAMTVKKRLWCDGSSSSTSSFLADEPGAEDAPARRRRKLLQEEEAVRTKQAMQSEIFASQPIYGLFHSVVQSKITCNCCSHVKTVEVGVQCI